jgi:thiol:disulfide interchange protein DsbG
MVRQFLANGGFSAVTQGTGPMAISIFFDPNCIFCHAVWTRLNEVPDWRNKFTVTWIPVSFLKSSSIGKGASILKAGPSGIDSNEAGFDDETETGAIAESSDQTYQNQVQNNTQVWEDGMQKMGDQAATPTVVIMNQMVKVGAPSLDFLDKLATLSGKVNADAQALDQPISAPSSTPAS